MNDVTKAIADTLAVVADALDAQREDLTKLDSRIGDGDLGLTITRGFKAIANVAAQTDDTDIGKLFMKMGMQMNRVSPSTIGTLLSFALLRAGKIVLGSETLTGEQVASMLEAAAAAIKERGKSDVGDKTILDALVPATVAFRKQIGADVSLQEAWAKAAQAAEAGAAQTTDMVSKVGRAGWLGEKTRGVPDPGATACAVICRAVSDHLAAGA